MVQWSHHIHGQRRKSTAWNDLANHSLKYANKPESETIMWSGFVEHGFLECLMYLTIVTATASSSEAAAYCRKNIRGCVLKEQILAWFTQLIKSNLGLAKPKVLQNHSKFWQSLAAHAQNNLLPYMWELVSSLWYQSFDNFFTPNFSSLFSVSELKIVTLLISLSLFLWSSSDPARVNMYWNYVCALSVISRRWFLNMLCHALALHNKFTECFFLMQILSWCDCQQSAACIVKGRK